MIKISHSFFLIALLCILSCRKEKDIPTINLGCTIPLAGSYIGSDQCNTISHTSVFTILQDHSILNRIKIINLYDDNDTVYADISCEARTLNIPIQPVTNGTDTISGTGIIHPDSTISLIYNISSSNHVSGDTRGCTLIMGPQRKSTVSNVSQLFGTYTVAEQCSTGYGNYSMTVSEYRIGSTVVLDFENFHGKGYHIVVFQNIQTNTLTVPAQYVEDGISVSGSGVINSISSLTLHYTIKGSTSNSCSLKMNR